MSWFWNSDAITGLWSFNWMTKLLNWSEWTIRMDWSEWTDQNGLIRMNWLNWLTRCAGLVGVECEPSRSIMADGWPLRPRPRRPRSTHVRPRSPEVSEYSPHQLCTWGRKDKGQSKVISISNHVVTVGKLFMWGLQPCPHHGAAGYMSTWGQGRSLWGMLFRGIVWN